MSKTPQDKSHNAPTRREPPPTITSQIEASFFGPIPPPSILEGYERIVPGAAERILKMAEDDAAFQREITFEAIRTEAAEKKRGQLLGFTITTFALATAAFALHLGHPTAAGVIGGATVVSLASVFVLGRVLDRTQEPSKPKSEKR